MALRAIHLVGTLTPAVDATIAALVLALLAGIALTIVIRRREVVSVPVVTLPEKVEVQRIHRATSTANVPADVQGRLRFLTGVEAAPRTPAAPDAPIAPASPAPTSSSARLPDDTTRHFGDDDPAADLALRSFYDATGRFDAKDRASDSAGDATRAFGDDPLSLKDDATQFFGQDLAPADEAMIREDATQYFGPDEDAVHAEDTTRFFGGDELDDEAAEAPGVIEGGTHTLPALPPATASGGAETGTFHVVDASDALADGTGFLPALPPLVRPPDTGALNAVRARLSSVAVPDVVALSVLDGAGRVLAGDNDADLTGEMRSLMAESGQGNMANVDQPVQLEDETSGALLLFPTGANALLGALVRDGADPDAVRAALRGLAHEIGDAMRRAS